IRVDGVPRAVRDLNPELVSRAHGRATTSVCDVEAPNAISDIALGAADDDAHRVAGRGRLLSVDIPSLEKAAEYLPEILKAERHASPKPKTLKFKGKAPRHAETLAGKRPRS